MWYEKSQVEQCESLNLRDVEDPENSNKAENHEDDCQSLTHLFLCSIY